MGLAFINAILLVIEWLRLNGKISLPEMLLRPHENKQIAGYIYFQMSALISIIIFEKTIAIAAILMLAIGDTAAGLAGAAIKGGNVRQSGNKADIKPFPIMVTIFLVCVIIGAILSNFPMARDMIQIPFWVYVAGALGATIGDTVPVRVKGVAIDDNFMIPLLSGAFMTAGMVAIKTIFH
ncbi:MAG: hypothetical protein O8C65_09880 [Candidatus Methanoperedens sp.]|nr:hypothetical protein [Candidatus Methanoperedens sp.]